ncbi:helix-turn-helix transcriptional regulator [Solwaraspora sp. WMMD1047]|uniref:helix-turn-helix domain-containing protein n=1 Tax=Solwaraspora sp. WMMD1047 TaxID=3016102 RepID=UPI0024170794|nr:helix-turn-helix transcriptional regulator [Solwaraspora sp. WMMD1047]MDG4834496.1 helix-turn-helix transcriptional regulator [Solwaraspora sp. WMMD1047]
MADHRVATLRAQWLGSELREMREQAGLTLKEVGEFLRRNPSTVSRFESGLMPTRVAEVLAYLDICGVDDPKRRDALKKMSQELFQKGWWDGYTGDVAGELIDRIWLESRATAICYFSTVVVPGLLQTREYAEAIIRTANGAGNDEQIERWIELRMARQRLLDRDEPLELKALLDESVARRLVGGTATMRAQLAHLVSIASRSGFEIRVLPFSAGAHASPDGPFDILRMAEPYPDAAAMHTPAGAVYVEAEKAADLVSRYHQLCDTALSPGDTVAFLSELVAEME